MKYKKEYIEELLGRFLEGLTSEAEEQTLSEYFCSAEDIPAEWQEYKALFLSFKTDAYDFSEEEIDAMLTPTPEPKARVMRLWPWASAACVAAVVALFVWHPWNNVSVNDASSIAEVKTTEKVLSKDSIKTSVEYLQESVKENTLVVETVINNKPANKELHSKDPKLVVANNTSKRKHRVQEKEHSPQADPTPTEDITTSELLETVQILADLSQDDVTITATRAANKGFVIKASNEKGTSNSYMLRQCSYGSSMEMTSQCIKLLKTISQ